MLTPLRRRAFSDFLLSPPITVVLTIHGAHRSTRSSTPAICLHSSRVGASTIASRPEARWICAPVALPSSCWLSDTIRCTIGSRYASVLPEPVSACRNASLSSRTSCGIVLFWIEVGAFIPSFADRCCATRRDRPSAWKLAASSESGALDGFAGSASSSAGSSNTVLGVGFEVKSRDVTMPPAFASCGPWPWPWP